MSRALLFAGLLVVSVMGCDSGEHDPMAPEDCVPTSCAAQAKDCGNISDGCGGTLDCGGCTSPMSCGGGGTPNLCGSLESAISCLDGSGPLVTVSGAQSSTYDMHDDFAADTRVDATTASWTSLLLTPVRVGIGDNICWSGGAIRGEWDPMTTSWETYHTTYAYSLYGNAMTVENIHVDNYGDSFHVRSDATLGNNFKLRGVYVTNNHDDCVENDGMKNGTIEESLFDGCYVFFSARGYGSGPTNVVTIQNNLIALQGFPTYYGGSTNDPSEYKNGGFWKIDEFDKAPKLSIHNNIFRADRNSHTWIPLTPDPRSIADASNNVIVWLGAGDFPDPVPPGFTVTRDASVWNNAVAAWKSSHGAP